MITQTAEPEEHIIVKRQAQTTVSPSGGTGMNVYPFTDGNYPAAFAIVAGVSIFLALIVLFIAVGMWNLDPGKDSIIYRMTTPRLKRE
uniref:Renin receptor n=1 Tax=Plectus sambesii TaxID=2011161 RepID=A0A914XCV1_9BILA